MGEFSVADEFRCLAAQCDVQAETDATGKAHRFFLRNLEHSLIRVGTMDAANLALIISAASMRMLDEELAQFIRDCAGTMRLGAAAEVLNQAVAA